MEAERSLQRKALPSILTTYEVEDVARDWAKNRAQRSDEPALLLLCPVKCESYFTDNGGLRDKSKDLFLEVCDTYRGVIESVKGEARQVRILYAPIDTIGCVEIIQANWKEAKNAPGGFEFTADYRVRSPGRQAIKGADAVLVSLCKILVAARKQVLAMEAGEKQKEADLAKVFAEKNEGFFKNIWLQLNGERKRRIGQANLTSSEAIRQQNAVKCMQETIEVLAKRDLGARVHEL
jgi:hypothetical protein